MNIILIISSVRENRVADAVLSKVKELIGNKFTYNVIDPLEYHLPFVNKRYYEMSEPASEFKKLHEMFEQADGFILLTAEYNHTVPPALTNMLDHFGSEFNFKSCGIISYSTGPVGGARATEHLRLICSTLGMPPVPNSPAWGLAHKSESPEGLSFLKNFERSFASFIEQFIWYTEAYFSKRKEKPS